MGLLQGGAGTFGDSLTERQRLVFQSIIVAGVGAGLQFAKDSILVGNVMDDRIRFSVAVGYDLRTQIEGNENFTVSGRFEKGWTMVFGWFRVGHRGADNFLARENRDRDPLQFGTGRAYAFLDIDGFHPFGGDVWSFVGHAIPPLNRVDYRSFLNEWGYEPCP